MSAIVHETNDQGNYAADRAAARLSPATVEQAKSIAVGHQDIDPNCSGETAGYHGWLYRVKRQSSEATVADILALEGRYQEAVARADENEAYHLEAMAKRDALQAERDELNQGCSWLAEALQATESCWNLAEHECTEVVGRLAVEQNRHDTTKRLLVQLQAEADDLRNRLAASAETHVSDLALMGNAYDALSVAHMEAIDILGRVAHCLVEHIDIGPVLTKQIMSLITKDATP